MSASPSSLPAGLNSLGVSQQQGQAGSPGKEQEKEGLCVIWLGMIERNKISSRPTLKSQRRVLLLSTLLEMEQRGKIQSGPEGFSACCRQGVS